MDLLSGLIKIMQWSRYRTITLENGGRHSDSYLLANARLTSLIDESLYHWSRGIL